MNDGKFWVCYEVFGRKLRQGPYETLEIAEENCRDIKIYEGVTGCWPTDVPPAEYKVLGE